MKIISKLCWLLLPLAALMQGCDDTHHHEGHAEHHGHQADEGVVEKGIHHGRLLKDNHFTLELAIFETGVPPEYRAWAYLDGKPINPNDVQLTIRLTRLGNKVDHINFAAQGDFLRGNAVIDEPHSFVVAVEAHHQGVTYRWQYDSFEGRTRIEPDIATALNIATDLAGPATLKETIEVFGTIAEDPARVRDIHARFDGVISAVHVGRGDTVSAGQSLMTIESNESLRSYDVKAPIAGVVAHLNAKTGQQTLGNPLIKIIDNSHVTAELAIFPTHLSRVQVGADVTVDYQGETLTGKIAHLGLEANRNQSVTARVLLNKSIPLGAHITARIQVDEYGVPLAVKRSGLQAFRDFTVVYAQVGDEYEVRMLELGRAAGDWVEVVGGLAPGTRYVTQNSYVIKSDIEKSGASHDH